MEERIKSLAKGMEGDVYEIAKQIQTILLWDLNQNVPLSFIIESIAK